MTTSHRAKTRAVLSALVVLAAVAATTTGATAQTPPSPTSTTTAPAPSSSAPAPTTTAPTTTGPTTGPTAPTTTGPSPAPGPTPQPRIVGGTTSQPGDGPWTVALVDATQSAYAGQFCGGSLIAPSWVLTAAHCTRYPAPTTIDVVTGRQLLSGSGGQRIRVARAYVDPDYNPYTDDNDLALLQLTDPSTSPTLPFMPPGFESAYAPGTDATIYGWGDTSATTTPSYPDELRQVTVPVLSDSTCSQPSVYGGAYHPSTMLCAGSYPFGGKDSCDGDSGGPLVVPFGYGVIEVGIVSWGVNNPCAQGGYPGVYTRVPAYANWISQGSRYGPFDRDAFIQRQFLDYTGAFAGSYLSFWQYILGSGGSPGSLIAAVNGTDAWDHTAGAVTRLYRAYFQRDPDSGGLAFWIGWLRGGRSVTDVSNFFASSSEFQSTYGSLDDGAFVDLVYQNVLGRAPDSGGRSYWLNRLANGLTRGGMMAYFSDSSEFRNATDAKVSRLIEWFGAMQRVPTAGEQSFLAGLTLEQIGDAIPNTVEYNARF